MAGVEIHVTSLCKEAQGFVDLAKMLRANLVIHECPQNSDVLAVAKKCHLAVGIPFSETFYYAGVEPVLVGTPCLTWPGIPALDASPAALLVQDPTNVATVATAITCALADGPALAKLQYTALAAKAACHNQAARKAICEMLG